MWDAEKVISIPAKTVENWMLPEMPGMPLRIATMSTVALHRPTSQFSCDCRCTHVFAFLHDKRSFK